MTISDIVRPNGNGQLPHYVLFGPPDHPATQVNLLLAQDYLLALAPMFGFSADEAAAARRVTIIGDPVAVDVDTEQRLASGGAEVRRIQGSVDEVARALAQLVASNRPS